MTREQKKALEPKIRMHIEAEERNVFRDDYTRRHHMETRSRKLVILGILLVIVYLDAVILPNGMDANNVFVSLAWWLDTLKNNIGDLAALIGGGRADYMEVVVCRFVIVGLVGAALALSGAVYQGSLKNGLASPTTLGVQAGGLLGGAVYVLFFMTVGENISRYSVRREMWNTMNIFQRYEESFFIMAGCFIAVIFVIAVAKTAGRGKISSVVLILSGMIFSSAVGGAVGLVRYWLLMRDTYGMRTYELRYMMMGTFSRTFTVQHLAVIGIPILIGIIIVMMMAPRLNLIVFGEDEARTMGLNVEVTRNVMLAVVTVLTAVVISFCGMIGFIGFITPHIARRITGPDFRHLIPGSALLGAICMIVIYYIATLVNYADNINFMTSIVGGSIFLVMLVRSRRRSNADWA